MPKRAGRPKKRRGRGRPRKPKKPGRPKKKRRKKPVLHRFRGKHPLYFGAKWDDFWWIERLWAIMGVEVYREPRVWTVKKLMRRVRETSKNIEERSLIKLVHQSPAKMNEIHRLKGKQIPPSFDPTESKFACKCCVCLS